MGFYSLVNHIPLSRTTPIVLRSCCSYFLLFMIGKKELKKKPNH